MEISINKENLKNGDILIYKDGEWVPIQMKNFFYDISVYLSTQKLKDLVHMLPGILINKDKKGLLIGIDFTILDKLYKIYKDKDGNIIQGNSIIPIQKYEPYIVKQPEVIKGNKENQKIKSLENRIAELEALVIRQSNQIAELKEQINK